MLKLREFIEKNQDVIIEKVPKDGLADVTDGTPLLLITISGGNAPRADRTVISASYALAVHNSLVIKGWNGCLDLLALTRGGYAKIESITPNDMRTKLLYRAKPLPLGDQRQNQPAHDWCGPVAAPEEAEPKDTQSGADGVGMFSWNETIRKLVDGM